MQKPVVPAPQPSFTVVELATHEHALLEASYLRYCAALGMPVTAGFCAAARDECVLIARDPQGGVAGWITLYAPAQFVHMLWVEPTWRRVGLARRLLHAAFERLGPVLTLKCLLRNAPAMQMYQRLGFEVVDYGESEDGAYAKLQGKVS